MATDVCAPLIACSMPEKALALSTSGSIALPGRKSRSTPRPPSRASGGKCGPGPLGGLAAIYGQQWLERPRVVSGPEPEPPRPVAARGDLAADEKATIELFERSKGSVVYISTSARVIDLFTRNIAEIPRGTGSGS